MDAVDLNWCLSSGCRIELEGSPYCSQLCMNSDKPSTSTLISYPTVSSFADRDSLFDDEDDSYYDHSSLDAPLASPSRNTWIGRGDAGIRAWAQSIPRGAPSDSAESVSRTLKPKLLDSRRAKPSLCMSRAQPAPPEPSRPILTPQQSLPSLPRYSTSIPSASMVSLTTGSSSYSIRTPATASEVGSLHEVPTRSLAHRTNFLGSLKAQFRAWASSSIPQKDPPRSSTVTRRPVVHIADDSDTDSAFAHSTAKFRRSHSPTPFLIMPEQYALKWKEDMSSPVTVEDHPAYRTRGRKASRVPP